jgi:hypothetical protein
MIISSSKGDFMVILNGRFDGSQIILDGPVPNGIPVNSPVRVIFDEVKQADSLAEIEKMARPLGLPPDYSEQHEHYIKGTPRR